MYVVYDFSVDQSCPGCTSCHHNVYFVSVVIFPSRGHQTINDVEPLNNLKVIFTPLSVFLNV